MFESVAYAMAQAPQAQGQAAPNPLALPMMLVMMFGIMYFLVLRPQQKKRKEHDRMVSELKKNDEVITTGGIHGTLVNVKDKTFTIRIDDNVRIEVSKSAVSGVKSKKTTE